MSPKCIYGYRQVCGRSWALQQAERDVHAYTPSHALDMVGKFAVWPHIPRKPCPSSLAYHEGTEKT